jgi:GntR family histidine utilization transcriptional repressor
VLPAFAPEILAQDFAAETPSAYLSAIAPLQEAEQTVTAEVPSAEVRKYLDMQVAEPCLVVTRRTWAFGKPVTFAHLYHPGSRFELSGHYSPPSAASLLSPRRTGESAS